MQGRIALHVNSTICCDPVSPHRPEQDPITLCVNSVFSMAGTEQGDGPVQPIDLKLGATPRCFIQETTAFCPTPRVVSLPRDDTRIFSPEMVPYVSM